MGNVKGTGGPVSKKSDFNERKMSTYKSSGATKAPHVGRLGKKVGTQPYSLIKKWFVVCVYITFGLEGGRVQNFYCRRNPSSK